jgi:NitT/TauT family transport system substrate-binding protein
VLALAGCGVLNGHSGGDGAAGQPPAPGTQTVRIGILAGPDDAPIKLAQAEGLFRAEGLDPVVTVFQSGPSMYPALMNGSLDIAETNYVNFFGAVAKKTLAAHIVAEAYSGTPSSLVLLTRPDSGIHTPADLAGKIIATQAPGNICELLVRALLRTGRLDPGAPRYVPIHFPDMPSALATKQIDAAVEFDPYIAQAQRDAAAQQPFPLLTGELRSLPLSGYAAADTFTTAHPATVAAFQRTVVAAHRRITQPGELATVLPGLTGVDAALVPALHVGDYPDTLEPQRLQQIITLMRDNGYPDAPARAGDVIVPLPGG